MGRSAQVVELDPASSRLLVDELEFAVAMRERWKMMADSSAYLSATRILPAIDTLTVAIEGGKAALLGAAGVSPTRALQALRRYRDVSGVA